MTALKNIRAGEVFIQTHCPDREVPGQHHDFGLPKPVGFQVRKRERTGLPF